MSPKDIVDRMMERDAFSRWLGIRIESVEEGSCTLSLTVRAEMLNGFDIAHGAIAYAIADSALAFASNSRGRRAVSIETSINHLEPLHEGDTITATAREDAVRNKLGFYTVDLRLGDRPIARFTGTVYRTGQAWEA
jgi:acyl-CoA thioesterase